MPIETTQTYWEPENLDKACTIGELEKALERYTDDVLVFYCDDHWFKAVPGFACWEHINE